MGRSSMFSFPIPGRKSHAAKDHGEKDISRSSSTYNSRVDEGTRPTNKAERLLGATNLPSQPSSRRGSSTPAPPGRRGSHTTVATSEASYESDYTERYNPVSPEDLVLPPRWQSLQHKASSNLLGAAGGTGSTITPSIPSDTTREIRNHGSSSTLRSYYDAKKSPLLVSQQTSNSAVRDRALRKGYPPIPDSATPYEGQHFEPAKSPLSIETSFDSDTSKRKRPAKLDLSKLFPTPTKPTAGNLLSPTKFVNSPSALSVASEYFPRHPPKLSPGAQSVPPRSGKLQKKPSREIAQQAVRQRSVERDQYDNAKVNVRRPPRGIQHWFEGWDDEDDEDDEVEQQPERSVSQVPRIQVSNNNQPQNHLHKTSWSKPAPISSNVKKVQISPSPSRGSRTGDHLSSNRHLASRRHPSQGSTSSHATKESKLSHSNLQNQSILSFSSSDEECENTAPYREPIRDSIAILSDTEGEIVIGKAQSIDVKARSPSWQTAQNPPWRQNSVSSIQSASTFGNSDIPNFSNRSTPIPPRHRSKRSGHTRQPSSIPEDVDRPHTSNTRLTAPMSPTLSSKSGRSSYTTKSEPRLHGDQHKLMAVTEEEEALLEMMRRKRAAMAEQNFSEGYKTALKQGRSKPAAVALPHKEDIRTSGFLTMDSPTITSDIMSSFPFPSSGAPSIQSRQSSILGGKEGASSPIDTTDSPRTKSNVTNILLENSSPASTPSFLPNPRSDSPNSIAPRLSPSLAFSPIDLLPPALTTPTTTSHVSPLPSPVTPRQRAGEELSVKVAGSETSTNEDAGHSEVEAELQNFKEKVALSRSTTVSSVAKSITPTTSATISSLDGACDERKPTHQRHSRSMKSRTSLGSRDSVLSHRSRHSRFSSNRTSRDVGPIRESMHVSGRCSVSDDVLAAWGSLGGWRDFESVKVSGL
ncbi:hypothetical protein M501DRAFT_1054707 [Patellaria atrata CBS 101060]|uniref:Uncharacterized protein n=1 Tax=Patellaria atrata CBS 101060 TaxID=1346257 RepID=A0A9P4SHL4_9PEZI|nr:hypothetical protein M501DRAFT_1054707 [Patellaria atrata CBS 101060]